jgi:hypothetical protein
MYAPPSLSHPATSRIACQWLDFILKQENIPQTISTSYGDDEQTGELRF